MGNEKPPPTVDGGRGFLQIHWATGSCHTEADPWDLQALRSLQRCLRSWGPPSVSGDVAGPPLYTGNDSPVIPPYVVVVACRPK